LNSPFQYTLQEDFEFIRFYNDSGTGKFKVYLSINGIASLIPTISKNRDNIVKNATYISDLNTELNGDGGIYDQESEDGRTINVNLDSLVAGTLITYSLLDDSQDMHHITAFLFRSDGTYITVSVIQSLNSPFQYTLQEDFEFIRFYNDSGAGKFKVYLSINGITSLIPFIRPIPQMRLLIIGDSYSVNGGNWVYTMMSMLPNGSSYISLAVGSATVRDRYKDVTTYPYTSRPISTDNSGNKNVLYCQVEKLKRLMAGTDLDEGETPIYQSVGSYPNVIIIEGGMNDTYDSDSVEDTYFNQFEKRMENVYIRQTSDSTPTLGLAYVETPDAEVDRTCFAGAYRHITQDLLSIFPNAQIFFTTASGLGYWNGSVIERRNRTAVQQRKCADLCAASVIDWKRDGQINSYSNNPSGTGTMDDPYIWGQNVNDDNPDSSDLMHPNQRGGRKYGQIAALSIINKFINIV
jgi:hypothetical protein